MILKTRLFGHTYEFKSVREVMAKANEEKSGDKLAGIAAETAEERVAAKYVLANLTLNDLRNNPAVPYEEDEVTRIIQDDVNEKIFNEIKNWTVSEFREWLLDINTTTEMIRRVSRGLTSEMVAGVCKLMSNLDLIYAARKMRVSAHCNTTIGLPGTFSSRLQPNHTTDDPKGIIASVMEGLSLGCGDAVIGLNPVDDSVESVARILKMFDEFKNKWEVPTQICVLAHVTTQTEAAKKFGAPLDLMFQSIAGSQKGNEAFGLTAEMLEEGRQTMLTNSTATGPNVMYFETGQGSELSSNAHNGWDQVTMEARCYGFAKRFQPFLVNTVVGFIGPEYLYDSKQVTRAGLEDHFMGKLTGIPMGCDACYTNHMKADQNDIENLAALLVSAGCNYIMGVPEGDDCMLMYQCTGYHEAASLREIYGLRPIHEFDMWLEKMGFSENGKLTKLAGDASVFMTK
ncbi:MAG: ethanolamine ammonia-lyase subunit EutB [Clostridiales bacterium]|uniref:ethanolamine ammonia-lyase subunit EutB n=1 Tax=Chordicoccus furentiruminis TaxID=2709410 RepID=UPI0023A86289|nr:ethanolamine ammonia-lyase subunit EutB [Chordicoccus furentiruminis]MCI6173430.1 ethanolamine ammonia-lyase subunit EutB [Clostridiales bacterium]